MRQPGTCRDSSRRGPATGLPLLATAAIVLAFGLLTCCRGRRHAPAHGDKVRTDDIPAVYNTPRHRGARWLWAQRRADGTWPSPAGGPVNTALVLLVLHQQGHDTLRIESDVYDATLRKAVDHLLGLQDQDGGIGVGPDGEHLRDHAICTLVLAELAERRYDGRFADKVAAAVRYLRATRERWSSVPSVAVWAVLALRETTSLEGVSLELDDAPPGVRALARIALGADPRRSDPVKEDMKHVLSDLDLYDPSRTGVLTWLFAQMVCFEYGGSALESASAFLQGPLAQAQRDDGSWDLVGHEEAAWLGRVGVTALTVLAYESRCAGANQLGLR